MLPSACVSTEAGDQTCNPGVCLWPGIKPIFLWWGATALTTENTSYGIISNQILLNGFLNSFIYLSISLVSKFLYFHILVDSCLLIWWMWDGTLFRFFKVVRLSIILWIYLPSIFHCFVLFFIPLNYLLAHFSIRPFFLSENSLCILDTNPLFIIHLLVCLYCFY